MILHDTAKHIINKSYSTGPVSETVKVFVLDGSKFFPLCNSASGKA